MRRTLISLALAGALVLGGAAPALADHTLVRMTGNGSCVILAAGGGEKYVALPHAEEFPDSRRHPLHINVHLGRAGSRHGEALVWVLGSAGDLANCDGYVN